MTTHSLRVRNLLLFSSLSWLQAHLDWFVFVTALSSGSPPSLDARFSCYFICPSTGFNIYYTPFSLLRLNKFWSLKHQQLCNSASSPESQLTKTGSGFKARPLDSLSHNIHIYWPLLEILTWMHAESGGSFLTAMLHCWLVVLHKSLHTVLLVYPQSSYTLSNAKCLNLKQFQLEAAEKSSQNNSYEISASGTLEQERSTEDKSTVLYFKTQIHK